MKSVLKEIYSLFRLYPGIFPHIRQDYVERAINERRIVLTIPHMGADIEGALIYKQYKRDTKFAKKNDYLICQIVACRQREGIGTRLLQNFLEACDTESMVVVKVRDNNVEARKFYQKHGFVYTDVLLWDEGLVPGIIYKRRVTV